MYFLFEIEQLVQLLLILIPSTLAFILIRSSPKMIGEKWLLAFIIITLLTSLGSPILKLIQADSPDSYMFYTWDFLFRLLSLFGPACFGLFLFANWIVSRMKLDIINLLFSFNGRIPRSAFWIIYFICLPVIIPFLRAYLLMDEHDGVQGILKIIFMLFFLSASILYIWISLAIYTKRWHDCSKSGWMSLILLIPVIGWIWLFGYLGLVRGTLESNQYGENPLNIGNS